MTLWYTFLSSLLMSPFHKQKDLYQEIECTKVKQPHIRRNNGTGSLFYVNRFKVDRQQKIIVVFPSVTISTIRFETIRME